tara:strand:+ start:49555 stop:50184 length:630 start_codon:yes stop_codon:yes gene_type:complete
MQKNSFLTQLFNTGWRSSFVGVIVLIGLGLTSFTAHYPKSNFSAYIIQNGKRLPIDKHVVQLKREPFEVVVDMPDKNGVFVNVSFNAGTYNGALRNVQVADLKGFQNVAMYEVWKNPNQELLVSDDQPSYWFIDSRINHRFSYYDWVNNRYIGTREVQYVYDVNMNIKYEIKDVKKSLYLTFIQFYTENENYRAKELMRHEFKIEWIND